MPDAAARQFRSFVADRLRAEHVTLAARWLERLKDVLRLPASEVFPTDSLLDHIPELVLEIANYLDAPDAEEIAANSRVLAKAQQLGSLRYAQQASVHQIMREYRILEAVLLAFVREEIASRYPAVSAAQALALAAHIHQAASVLQDATVQTFIGRYADTIAQQTQRLESFNRMVSHELRQPLGALQFAIKLLRVPRDPGLDNVKYVELMERNIDRVAALTTTLARLSGMHVAHDGVHTQEIPVATVAREVVRQLRDMAQTRGVRMEVDEQLPTASVDVGALELALLNLVSNAVKYADPAKPERHVRIHPGAPMAGAHVVAVTDNGLGIPASRLSQLFQPSGRLHAERDTELNIEGLGLGLVIARDCARAFGGDIDVSSTEGVGTTFTLWFPHVATRTRSTTSGS
jgi:signal transduction histidine kinase